MRTVHVAPIEEAVVSAIRGHKIFPLDDVDLLIQFPVETGYVFRSMLDQERLLDAFKKTLACFPLYCGRFHSPDEQHDYYYMDMSTLHPIEVEIVSVDGGEEDALVPDDRVIQNSWRWTKPLDYSLFRRGNGEGELMKMRITRFRKRGWTAVALTTAHIAGDGGNMVLFWNSFSSAYATGNPLVPSYDRPVALHSMTLTASRRDSIVSTLPMLTGRNPSPPPPTRLLTVYISDAAASALKQEVRAAINDPSVHFSLQDCLIALISRSCARKDMPMNACGCVYNARGTVVQPVKNSAMNCLMWPSVRWDDDDDLPCIVKKLRGMWTRMRDEQILKENFMVTRELWRDAAEKKDSVDFGPKDGWTYVNSSIKFEYTTASFGCLAEDIHFIHTIGRSERFIKMFRRNAPLQGGQWKKGIEISFCLKEENSEGFFKQLREEGKKWNVKDIEIMQ